ncbi:MAG: hypothetical protein J1E85_05960 [Ruminococcus sp.]|nr:hypothetical protein [Ruminococcus sp.]
MENTTKTDNFLAAIKKHAEKQRQSIQTEVKHIKEEKIKEAEKKGKLDSEKYISDKLEAKKNEETSKVAKLMQEGQKELFLKRVEMTESVFNKAEEKLIKYTQTDEYSHKLIDSAKAISEIFGDKNCTLNISEKDLGNADKISALFSGKAEVTADKSIKIGGIKGYCSELNIIADETLDSKLAAQREWFVENSGLSVL